MNTITIFSTLIALLTGLAGGAAYMKNTDNSPTNTVVNVPAETSVVAEDFVSIRPAINKLPSKLISDEENSDLVFMREEEKLARDVYQTLFEKWNLPIFSNIAQSEQTHTEAVRDLLLKYNIQDPVTNDTVGVFQNNELQALYTTLIEKGLNSEVAALEVGATIEDLDIKDLERAIAQTDNEDIILVYENLTRGSRNHLRAFTRQLSSRGVVYETKYITDEEYKAIISSDTERGANRQGGKGRGWGQ